MRILATKKNLPCWLQHGCYCLEGYGLPPVEAQYVGTPVICSDLPVLKEVNRFAKFVDFENKELLKKVIIEVISNPPSTALLHQEVADFATYESFSRNLKQILDNYD